MNQEVNSRIEPIDIKKLFYNKNPKLASLLPGFVYGLIKRIVHVDFVNEILREHGDKRGIDFAKAVIKKFNIKVEVKGSENLPSGGRFIFASNHPLGGFDGIVLLAVLNNYYPELRFLVNDLLMNLRVFDPLFVPINKHGTQSRGNVELIDEVYAGNAQVLTFPAGLVSRRQKGVIQDLEWKKNFISKAIEYKRDVIPVHFDGHNTNFFYTLASLRKFFRIKSNLEMFFLPDETFRHRNENITVIFGKPVPYTDFTRDKSLKEWAEEIKRKVYKLAEKTV